MAATKLYVSTKTAETGTRPDVCADSQPAPCQPECLVKPRYFCGQLLTDQDLTALVQWNDSKFRLDRYKLGWGVVDGLRARCNPQKSASILLEPGYAVDACGNDIVVCEAAEYDLSAACDAMAKLQYQQSLEYTGGDDKQQFFDLDIPPGQCFNVVLYIHYNTEGCDPQPALGRGACTERDACEFSRTKETYSLSWKIETNPEQQLITTLVEWEKNYFNSSRQPVTTIARRIDLLVGDGDISEQHLEPIKAIILDWIEKHPLSEFCFLVDAVNCLEADSTNPEGENGLEASITEILYWIVLDCRLSYLARWPAPTSIDAGVPLARLRMQRREGCQDSCHILHIDNMPPTHRPIAQDRWPAPLGYYNLGQLIWHTTDDACAQLHDKMIEVDQKAVTLPTTIDELIAKLEAEWPSDMASSSGMHSSNAKCRLFTHTGCHSEGSSSEAHRVSVLTYENEIVGKRVIGFCQDDASEGTALSMEKKQVKVTPTATQQRSVEQVSEAGNVQSDQASTVYAELHRVKGIGPTYEKTLSESMGVTTLSQLAKVALKELQQNFPKVSDEELASWREQAKELEDNEQ